MKTPRTSTRSRHTARLILAGSILALLGSSAAHAANQTWTGSSTVDGSWATTANWGNNTPPGATSGLTNTDIAIFNAPIANTWGNSAANPVLNDRFRNISGIIFDGAAGNYFIGEIGSSGIDSLRVTGGGAIQIRNTLTSTNFVGTINAALSIQGTAGYTLRNASASGSGAGAGTLNFGGAISSGTNTSTLFIDGSNTNANTISGRISGSNTSLVKSGVGTWTLTADNTYAGDTTINGGTLTLAFGNQTANIIPTNSALILSGGTLQLTGTGTQAVNGFSSGGASSRVLLGENQTLTLGGLTSAGAAVNFNTAAGGANGATIGTGVVKISGQTQGAAIHPGYTVSDAGGFGLATVDALNQVIRMAAPNLLPASGASSTTNYHINNNAGGAAAAGSSSLAVTSTQSVKSLTVDTTAIAGTLTLSSGVTLSSDTWNFGGVGANPFKVTGGTGIKALTTNATLVLNNYNPAPVTIKTPILSNGGDVTVQGTGKVILSAANSYTGNTIINGGTLEVATGGSISVGSASILAGFSGGQAATFNITGGSVSDVQGFLGVSAGTSATSTVSAGTWNNSVNLFVGQTGIGVLNVTNTGVVGVGGGGGTVRVAADAGSVGTLNLGLGGTAGTINAAIVNGGSGLATVNFNQTGAYTFNPQLTGSLKVNKLGAGTTTLTKANTYTGATTVSGGTLALAFGAVTTNILPSTTPLTLSGGALQLTGTGNQTVSGLSVASGANQIVMGANENLTLGALTSVAAGSALNFNVAAGGGNANLSTNGTSLITVTGQPLGAVINNQFTVTDAGGFGLASVNGSDRIVRLTNTTRLPASGASSATNYLINNNASGAGAAGSSTLAIAASQSTLSTTVDTTAAAGVVTLGSGVTFSNDTWNFGGVGSNGWQITGGTGIKAATTNGTITFNNFNPAPVTINTPIVASTAVNVRGTGTTIFSAANINTGDTLVRGGTLELPSGGSITGGANSVIVGFTDTDVATFNLTGGSVNVVNGFIGVSAGTSGMATVSSGSWTTMHTLEVGQSGAGVLNLTGGEVHVFSLGTLVLATNSGSTGTLNLGTGSTVGTLNAGAVYGGSGTATVNFNHTGVFSFAPHLTGSLAVNKLGSGTTTLTGAETFTGLTEISQGALLVNGSLTSSAVTVETGATLGGTGTVGAVTVQSGGFLEGGIGASTGALTLAGNVSLLDGSSIELTLGGSFTHSTLARTGGTWVFDSDQAFTFNIGGGATSGVYQNVITGLSGSEAGLATINAWQIDHATGVVGTFSYDGAGGVDLTVSTIPEPRSAITLVGGVLLLGLRGRFRSLRAM